MIALFTLLAPAALMVDGRQRGRKVATALYILLLLALWKVKVYRFSKTDKMILTWEAEEMRCKTPLARRSKS